MSWSQGVNGSPADVRAQYASAAAAVEATDRQYSANDALIAAHQRQVATGGAVVEAIAALTPEGFVISGSVSGHSDGITSDSLSISMSCYKPSPTA